MKTFLREFREDESGTVAIELLLTIPILVWALLSTLVYFDAYHDEAISNRAGLVIADMISREKNPVDAQYIIAAQDLLKALTETDANPDIRVTVYEYRETEDDYQVVWSHNLGYGQNHTDASFLALQDSLPLMADGDVSILVETKTEYRSPFTLGLQGTAEQSAPRNFFVPGLKDIEFRSFTVISPRFNSTVCWERPSPLPPLCRLSDRLT